jgi:murein tripeptide amidase MpaA
LIYVGFVDQRTLQPIEEKGLRTLQPVEEGMALKSLICLVLLFSLVISTKLRYDGQSVIKLQLKTPAELKRLQQILPVDVDIWSHDSNLILGENHIRVNPELLRNINQSGFAYNTWIKDLQQWIEAEDEVINGTVGDNTWYQNYHTYDEFVTRLSSLASTYSNIAQYVPAIGKSIQGRNIPAIIIGNSRPTGKIFWVGGQHAREWIGPASVMYMVEQLLEEYTKGDTVTRSLVTNLQFIIVPIANPDGYVYSWATDRLWRKNRRANAGGSYGVDLNRNWDAKWGGAGGSNNPASDTYFGTAPFSEPESKALADCIRSYNSDKKMLAAIDFHAYSQLILRPYGWSQTLCPDETALKSYGANMQAQIKSKYGLNYDNIRAIELYVTTGSSIDWFYQEKIVGAFGYELRDTGTYGFKLPANQIIPTGVELWAACKSFTKAISGL